MIRRGIGVQPYTVGATPFIGLLDTYTNAAAAYSVRKLRSDYTGSVIRVRRSSDNTEQDIGFDVNGNLDESALTTFVGANNGFVTTWYDQSGNSRNAIQSTAANQPQIVTSGIVEKENSKPIIKFDGSNDSLIADGSYSLATNSIFATVKSINTSPAKTIFARGSQSVGGTRREAMSYIGSTFYDMQVSNDTTYPTARKSLTPTNFVLASGIITGSTGTMTNYINGVSGTTATSVSAGLTGTIKTTIGGVYEQTAITYLMNGKISEIIVYNTNESSNRTGIESNINSYYSIY